MTNEERIKRIAELRTELKELRAVMRSDWHAGFEALLLIDTHKYGNRVHVQPEVELGVDAPRADYLIIVKDETVEFDKEIFKGFRKFNVLEYKNPDDSLNERVIRKICGYANFYIGCAEHEGDVPSDQVTISIFRAAKNTDLFNSLTKSGNLIKTDTPGIYQVIGITDLPFQIVITSELEGAEYAAYRALTTNAKENDVEQAIESFGKDVTNEMQEYYRTYLKLVVEKNPEMINVLRREDAMEDVLMEIVKDRVDERVNTAQKETLALSIRNIMSAFNVSSDKAMDVLNIPMNDRPIYVGLINKN